MGWKSLFDTPLGWTHVAIIAILAIVWLRQKSHIRKIEILFNGKNHDKEKDEPK